MRSLWESDILEEYDMKINEKDRGIYNALVDQLDRLARHNRQGAFRTRDRYYEAMKRFCRFLAEEYRMQKLSNVSGKHFVAYVEYMQEHGKSASTIKTDLAAIRFFHEKMNAKYRLPDNDELSVELERRRFGGVDRTWSATEFNRMIGKAVGEGRDDIACALYLGRYAGLRIHEVMRLDTATAERALREDAITVKGKGGKIRTVPIEDDRVRIALRRMLNKTERGHKLFVPDDVPTDRAINGVQLFIIKHRDGIADPDREANLTFHGLRHTYAAVKYHTLTENGTGALEAHFAVSRLLGHERADVTDIYLASAGKKRKGEAE